VRSQYICYLLVGSTALPAAGYQNKGGHIIHPSLRRPASELLLDGAGFFGDHIAGVGGGFPFEQKNVTLLLSDGVMPNSFGHNNHLAFAQLDRPVLHFNAEVTFQHEDSSSSRS
jgi:hypothetical protein